MSPLFSPDWKKSPAHLELLSKFIRVESPDRFIKGNWSSEWQNLLKEYPAKAIERFVKENYLVYPDLSTSLDYKFKVTDYATLFM